METDTPSTFAYGSDEIDDCKCPARAAGFHPSHADASYEIATQYDWQIKQLGLGNASSIVSEEDAKKAWFTALENMRDKGYPTQYLSAAEEIAEELGWEVE